MAIKYLHFAVKPRVCDVCNRIFILEPFNIQLHTERSVIGLPTESAILCCKRCKPCKKEETT